MTVGNRKRVQKVMVRLNEAIDRGADVQGMIFILHEAIADIVIVLNDLNLRPEVNSER